MSGWGISPKAPKIEQIKAKSADYLHGYNSTGVLDWKEYSQTFDFYEALIMEAYYLGKTEAKDGEQE